MNTTLKRSVSAYRKALMAVCFLAGLCWFNPNHATAQGSDSYGKGFRIELGDSGRRYVRIINWHQFWCRYMENNPSTLINGAPSSGQTDFVLRRSRLMLITQLNPKFMIMTHMGINNQTITQGGQNKPVFFIHDATVEHKIYKDYLTLGGGLHFWNGVSRMTNAGTMSFLTFDAPNFNWGNIDVDDFFVRLFGIYAKGKLGRLDYRVAVNQPFLIGSSNSFTKLDPQAAAHGKEVAAYNGKGMTQKALQGYFMYQFWDQESNLLPYMPGTYIGTKRVFNIGAGFFRQGKEMWAIRPNSTDTVYHDQMMWAADVFLDMPFGEGKKMALTAYGAYYNYNYGPNFIRYSGISNIGTGVSPGTNTPAAAGNPALGGNSFPMFGTGHIYYGEMGVAFPKMGKLGRLQPYFRMSHANFQRIKAPVQVIDVGANLFLEGHQCKLTINYRMRPTFKYDDPSQPYGDIVKDGFRPEVVLQMQIAL